MKIIKYNSNNISNLIKSLTKNRSRKKTDVVDTKVKKIIHDIEKNGNKSLLKYINKYDSSGINRANILLSKKTIASYPKKIDNKTFNSFLIAIDNITNFHKKQKPKNYSIKKNGVSTISSWKPIESVGLYVPGGKASYPSSLIMNLVPAIIAGVKRIVVATPNSMGEINPYILGILSKFNITEVYQMGGAHAIAALAYGTETIDPVNKIFGPGNAYVSSAKKQVFGKVGIDLIAGPSEIVVVADDFNNPSWVAADLMAQAEHDERAQSILITNSLSFAKKTKIQINNLIKNLNKKQTILNSFKNFGFIIVLENFDNLHTIINQIAPEHLHLQHKSKNNVLKKIINAGAIFIGEYSSEAFGDYIVGTNHILPTSAASKFSSGLGVLDFMKRTSIVEVGVKGFSKYSDQVSKMADVELLDAHKLSVTVRQNNKK